MWSCINHLIFKLTFAQYPSPSQNSYHLAAFIAPFPSQSHSTYIEPCFARSVTDFSTGLTYQQQIVKYKEFVPLLFLKKNNTYTYTSTCRQVEHAWDLVKTSILVVLSEYLYYPMDILKKIRVNIYEI